MAVDCCSYNLNEHKMDEGKHEKAKEYEEKEDEEEDDDYIDMEVSSYTTTLSAPSQNPREFEFQMGSTINVERDTTTSPADELFYMGKLLPLHLPPRLQMVEKLLEDSTPKMFNADFFSTPLGTHTAVTPITSTTPFESCNVSPVESCQVSREINPQEYFFVYANENNKGFMGGFHGKKSWTKKLKTKIKALFGKSHQQCSLVAKNEEDRGLNSNLNSKKDDFEKHIKGIKKHPCIQIPQINENDAKEAKICHRRSFSGVFKRRSSTTKLTTSYSSISPSSCSSSSSCSSNNSSNSNGLNDFPMLKRSSSANSEMESSLIQGAIAHCKKSSKQAFHTRKTLSEIGSMSLPSTRFTSTLEDLTTLCRG
ncbi:probable membrane-associated kinase regulator 4 [Amaranthus tricolor]|uniref:probable membrane-associated kinase regulator 4 n=1 Tax=Amaranthus tricolor TaxID=29722 RepID=UPI002583EAA5|nr:probable membrane-associated kinase regulator 4 [Amaranthus tricolor]